MKKYHFVTAMLLLVINSFAQNITLTFNGTGAANRVDSVFAVNQTTGQYIAIAGNVLELQIKTGFVNLNSSSDIIAYPNPFNNEVSIIFPVEKTGNVKVSILNTIGQLVSQSVINAQIGKNKVQFSANNRGIYIAHILTPTRSFKVNLLCEQVNTATNKISYLGTCEISEIYKHDLKSMLIDYLSYTPGDRIFFTLKSGNNYTVLSDIPTQNKNYELIFVPCTDGDKNSYKTVKIGTQVWMAENLKTTKYVDETPIHLETIAINWTTLKTPAYCYYNNNEATYKATYGALYNWYVVDTVSNGNKNVCPIGWHVSSDADWTNMENYLIASGFNYDAAITGNKYAKSLAINADWSSDSGTGTLGNTDYPAKQNATGFSALPGGKRHEYGSFEDVGKGGIWWSSSDAWAWRRGLYYLHANVGRYPNDKAAGYSLRCVWNTASVILPILTTTSITNTSIETATSGGNISYNGGAAIIERGVCWSTSQNPTIVDSKTTDGAGVGSFTSNITGLNASNTYYIRAYATNIAGTAYGPQVVYTIPATITLPTLTTYSVNNISTNTAISGGNVTSGGGATVTSRGICWSLSQNPTIADYKSTAGDDIDSFTSNISGLTSNTEYYVRAYATNIVGTAYGNELSFVTSAGIIDGDGNIYDYVIIGNQSWLKENLKTTKYNDGTEMTLVTDSTAWGALTTPAYCYNSNSISYKNTYGALYNWYVLDYASNGCKNVCPIGWHVPSNADWVTLITYLGGEAYAGAKLKEAGTEHWYYFNPGATNETGFTALPGSRRWDTGYFGSPGFNGSWWSSTASSEDLAYSLIMDGYGLGNHFSYLLYSSFKSMKIFGYSVRCMKDTSLNPILYTSSVNNISTNTAISGGGIISNSDTTFMAFGVCWSTKQLPTITDSKTTDGTGIGCFNSIISGLSPNTPYFVRAYATNSNGTIYGNQVNFTTPDIFPILTTSSVTNITENTATSGGNITYNGGTTIIARGVCWSTSENPTISDSKTTDSIGNGSFSSNITGLIASTTYYIRAYATNSSGTVYGNQISITTPAEIIIDVDGNKYPSVIIGTQTWLAQNLKTTKYNDGTPIPLFTDSLSLFSPSYCYYNNNETTLNTKYGALYNWYAVNTSSNGNKNVCPVGWHIPSFEEWITLENYLIANGYNYDGTISGSKIAKALAATTDWFSSTSTGAAGNNDYPVKRNITGFSALPGGQRNGREYRFYATWAEWWSSSAYNDFYAWSFSIGYDSTNLGRLKYDKIRGYSVRCVKD